MKVQLNTSEDPRFGLQPSTQRGSVMETLMKMVMMMKPSRSKSSCGGNGGDLTEAAAMETARRQGSAVMCCGRCWRSAGSPPLYIGLGGASNSPPTNPRS